MTETPALQLSGIEMHYGFVRALDGIDIHVMPGEVVALLGDNGAGKSTLLKVMSGAHRPSNGTIRVRGEEKSFHSPSAAADAGVQMVYQDLSLVEPQDIAVNLNLGQETLRKGLLGWLGFVDRKEMRRSSERELDRLGVRTAPMTRPVEMLSGGQRQVVALARSAIRVNGESQGILLLDEPTAALGYEQTKNVEGLIRRMADQGIAIVVVTHDLPLCFEVADRLVILNRGKKVADLPAADADRDHVVGWITGSRPSMYAELSQLPSMSESQTKRVLIVGGGITGGVLALALRQQGVEVVLVDLRESLGGVGHGITLQGNALKAFKSVGIYEQLAERGFAFNHLRLKTADGHVIAEIPTPPMGGPDLPGTMGAVRGDIADILAVEVEKADVDVRLGTTLTAIDDHGDSVTVTLSDGSQETVDLLVGADGIRSKVRSMIGISDEPRHVGMGIWRTVAKRPAEMDCSEMYYGGPKFKAGYTPISDELCYAFLLEEDLDRSYLGEGSRGAELKERGQGYGGIWGQVRDSLADDAIVNYQWIEAICVESPWHRGRTIIIGDAAHACPPLIAQGAAMCAEDAVILAEMLTSGSSVDEVLPAFMERRFPRVKMVLDNSLTLADWEIHPETEGADPGRIMGQTLHALVEPA